MKPDAERQLKFLQQIQQLFEDGNFTATYKFALLMALAELAVEKGTDDTSELVLDMCALAEKFAEFYWPQTLPYVSGTRGTEPSLLIQNKGRQAAVINALQVARNKGAATLSQARCLPGWDNVIRQISRTVRDMPVKHLQYVGSTLVPFLYDMPLSGERLVLKDGVAAMLRAFHPLIQQLARAGWVDHVRRNMRNARIIGRADGLEDFMFGSQRKALLQAGEVLAKLQSHICFYCSDRIRSAGDVDHFIPWVKYPRDLAHNFVLAHSECNRSKSDMLGAVRHLDRWLDRNRRYGASIDGELTELGFLSDHSCSMSVARWAYEHAVSSGAYGWIKRKATEPLGRDCLELLAAPG
jgi:5-methylcytosine-specific restriction endonuclease McrA